MTNSGVAKELATTLADALVSCGPSVSAYLSDDIPGALSIPDSHAVARDCLGNAYAKAWREAYVSRFRAATVAGQEPELPDVASGIVDLIDGCDAAGAVILGASNAGNLDTFALSTLEWTCLDARLDPGDFLAAFPFPTSRATPSSVSVPGSTTTSPSARRG
ncbi:MAG: hypothetical protein R2695_05025 [Acidimicrobiales bacterium]